MGWVDNRCRRVWQKYLGKLEDIVAAVHGVGQRLFLAEVLPYPPGRVELSAQD